MKITILAFTAFVVATAPLAWAQEETATPAPAPEATAPEKSPSPATDASVSVSTEKPASPAADKGSSPAGPTRASSPAKTTAASTKSAPTAAVMPTKKSTVEATLKDIEDKWEASIPSRDPAVVQAYLADDFRGVTSKGKVVNKSGLLAEIKKDTDTYTSAKNGNMDVRVYGGHFAVVMGTSTEVGKGKDGKAFKRSFRWTDAWVDRNGKWQCVASQALLLSK